MGLDLCLPSTRRSLPPAHLSRPFFKITKRDGCLLSTKYCGTFGRDQEVDLKMDPTPQDLE